MSAACQNHPRREAIGVCIACRAQVCNECVTKVDGINHCVGCYAKMAERAAKPPSRAEASRVVAYVAAGGLFALAVAMTWAWLEVALPGAG